MGASESEVLEAVEVGIEMTGGPGTVSARFALEVMDRVFAKQMTLGEYVSDIGLTYLVVPAVTIAIGFACEQVVATLRESSSAA